VSDLAVPSASREWAVDWTGFVRALASTVAPRGEASTVAVVGNQPLGPDPARAAVIDGCDLVVRVNGFRLDGEHESVGNRCDVVIFNRGLRATPWFFDGYRDRLYLLIEPGRLHWEPEALPGWWPVDLGFVTVPNRDVVVPLSERMGYDPVGDGLWPTTGAMAIAMADLLFPLAELHVAGFSFLDEPDQTAWDHAYGESCIVGPEHRLSNESRWLNDLVRSGRAHFHR
jgi:hypothetical protein